MIVNAGFPSRLNFSNSFSILLLARPPGFASFMVAKSGYRRVLVVCLFSKCALIDFVAVDLPTKRPKLCLPGQIAAVKLAGKYSNRKPGKMTTVIRCR